MTVGLVMIVKDEAAVLPRLADSVRDHIDYWTVVDTGSTDDTLEVLDRIFTPVPGQVLRHDFDGFGPTRNIALRAAEPHTDWMLCLDADEELHGEIEEPIGADCVEAYMVNGDLRFWLPRLLRSHRGWESRGRAHEYYTSPVGSPPIRTMSFYIEHHGDGHDRPNKYSRDIPLLLRDWEEDPTERTAFYLGRSYFESNEFLEAEDYLHQRVEMGGWPEEAFYARYLLGLCLFRLGREEQACGQLWRAWSELPQRVEPLVALAEHYRRKEQWRLAHLASATARYHHPPGVTVEGLFVDASMDWRIDYELSIAAWYVDEKSLGREAQARLTDWDDAIPAPYRDSVLANGQFYS
jgi:glycosyltransferase involved in cell wall biosynthesis